MTNFFLGLARGPIDHQSSSVINVIANDTITMGSAVKLTAPGLNQLLPTVSQRTTTPAVTDFYYAIAVGGDLDGIYGDGSNAADDSTRAAISGDGVVVVTQGRCLARVNSQFKINVGDPLSADTETDGGVLVRSQTGATVEVIARALQDLPAAGSENLNIIAVDVQREGATVFT